ncbi:MAG: NfeD family protein [Cyclobacteriaceae bacterium]
MGLNKGVFRRVIIGCLLIVLSISQWAVHAQDKPVVLLMKIDQEIDPRMNRYTELALDKAEEIEADYVVIEMDTYGGALNDADDIRTRILNFEKPVYVWINKDAASAGALISIACDSIYMTKGASIGAATVVTADGVAAPDKYQSYMRSIMRSTAEAKGRDPKIAEAMVDQNIEVDSVSTAGQVITFSTSEAIKFGFCEAQLDNIDEVMARSGVEEYELSEFKLDGAEKIIALFLNPAVSGILILIIIGGIYFELQTPGVGFPILASFVAAILYFTPYYLNGLAENWEIIMFFLGVALLAAEIFVIPGFGIAGILGLIFTIGSLVLVMLNNDTFDFSFVNSSDLFIAVSTTIMGLFGAIIVMFIGGVRLTNSQFFNRIALQDVQDTSQGYSSNFKSESFIGKTGVTYTVLRPSGKVMIEDNIYDAFTRGNYIEKGTAIEVIGEEGNSVKVKEIES